MKFYKEWRQTVKKVLKDKSIRYAKVAYKGDRDNSENDWHKVRNPVRMLWSGLIFTIMRYLPPCRLKNGIYRMFGAKIGKNVAIAYNVFLDPLFPELITIEDGVMIGSDCEIATHEFVRDWFAMGRTVIKKKAMISAFNVIGAGVTVGENSITGMFCFVKNDIPPNEFWVGVPAKKKMDLPKHGLMPEKDVEIIRYDN
ncbi:MAG: acyltransferase [Nanoarchaeota archaeon]|nr:acyltransferase [Nanoarchaeota archaeon]